MYLNIVGLTKISISDKKPNKEGGPLLLLKDIQKVRMQPLNAKNLNHIKFMRNQRISQEFETQHYVGKTIEIKSGYVLPFMAFQ